MNDSSRRALRTLIQLVAAGGATELLIAAAHNVNTSWQPILFAGSTLAISWAQNYCEDAGWIRPVLGTKEPRPQ